MKCELCGKTLEIVEIDQAENNVWVACPEFNSETEDADEHTSYPESPCNIVALAEISSLCDTYTIAKLLPDKLRKILFEDPNLSGKEVQEITDDDLADCVARFLKNS